MCSNCAHVELRLWYIKLMKKPKINYPPENLKWESLEKLIKDSGWGTEEYKTGDIQKNF